MATPEETAKEMDEFIDKFTDGYCCDKYPSMKIKVFEQYLKPFRLSYAEIVRLIDTPKTKWKSYPNDQILHYFQRHLFSFLGEVSGLYEVTPSESQLRLVITYISHHKKSLREYLQKHQTIKRFLDILLKSMINYQKRRIMAKTITAFKIWDPKGAEAFYNKVLKKHQDHLNRGVIEFKDWSAFIDLGEVNSKILWWDDKFVNYDGIQRWNEGPTEYKNGVLRQKWVTNNKLLMRIGQYHRKVRGFYKSTRYFTDIDTLLADVEIRKLKSAHVEDVNMMNGQYYGQELQWVDSSMVRHEFVSIVGPNEQYDGEYLWISIGFVMMVAGCALILCILIMTTGYLLGFNKRKGRGSGEEYVYVQRISSD